MHQPSSKFNHKDAGSCIEPSTDPHASSSRTSQELAASVQYARPLLEKFLTVRRRQVGNAVASTSTTATTSSADWMRDLQAMDSDMKLLAGADDESLDLLRKLDCRLVDVHKALERDRETLFAKHVDIAVRLKDFQWRRQQQQVLAEEKVSSLSRALDMPDGQAENEAIVHSGGFLPVYGHIQPAELPPLPVPDASADFTKTTMTVKLHQTKPSVVPTQRNKPGPAHQLPPILVKSSSTTAEQEQALLKMLASRRSYHANPRTQPAATVKTSSSVHCTQAEKDKPWFTIQPSKVVFRGVDSGRVYEETFKVLNTSGISRSVRCLEANDTRFSIVKYEYPGDVSFIAPGMAMQCTVKFTCDEATEASSFITVMAEDQPPIVVDLLAVPTVFKLNWISDSGDELDCGYSVVGGTVTQIFTCKNEGAPGEFVLVNGKDNSDNATDDMLSVQEFRISPRKFSLATGESADVMVTFMCSSLEPVQRSMKIIFNETQSSHIFLSGGGEVAMVTIRGDNVIETTTEGSNTHEAEENYQTRYFTVNLADTNPNTPCEASLAVENLCHSDLQYEWRVDYAQHTTPGCTTHTPSAGLKQVDWIEMPGKRFIVRPVTEVLNSCTATEVRITFCSDKIGECNEDASLWVTLPAPRQSSGSGVDDGSQGDDAPVARKACLAVLRMTASNVSLQLSFNPPALVFPPLLLWKKTEMKFTLDNSSVTSVDVDWSGVEYSEGYDMSVCPQKSSVAAESCTDFTFSILPKSTKPLDTNITCRLLPAKSTAQLAVVAMKVMPPEVIMQEGCLDFGVVRRGTDRHLMLPLRNLSDTPANVTLKDTVSPSRLRFLPSPSLSLPPRGTSTVVVTMLSDTSCRMKTVLECCVEDGDNTCLSVLGCVESSSAAVSPLVIQQDDMYVGVPFTFQAKLKNTSQLPTVFSWKCPIGPASEYCDLTVAPATALLDCYQEADINFTMTISKPGDLKDLLIGCEVQDMSEPVLLQLTGCVKGPTIECELECIKFPQPCTVNSVVDVSIKLSNPTPASAVVNCGVAHFPTASAGQGGSEISLCSGMSNVKTLHNTSYDYSQSYRLKQQQKEARQLLALKNGAAFEIDPAEFELPAQSAISVTIHAYADMWGEYHDRFICAAEHMEDFSLPMVLNVTGCPLSFATSSRTEGHPHHSLLCFGTKTSEALSVQRPVTIANNSSSDIRVDWQVTTFPDIDDDKPVECKLLIGDPFPLIDSSGCKQDREMYGRLSMPALNSTAIARTVSVDSLESLPENEVSDNTGNHGDSVSHDDDFIRVAIGYQEGKQSTCPFSMSSNQMVIPAYSKQTVYSVFDPNAVQNSGNQMVVAKGYLSLDNQPQAHVLRNQGYDADHMQLVLTAEVEKARFDIQQINKFPWTVKCGDLIEAKRMRRSALFRRTYMLHNDSDGTLTASLSVEAPFQIMTSSSSASDTSSTSTPSTATKSSTITALSDPNRNISVAASRLGKGAHPVMTGPSAAGPGTGQYRHQQASRIHDIQPSEEDSLPRTMTPSRQGQRCGDTTLSISCAPKSVVSVSVGFLLSLDWLKHISKLKDEEDKESGDREEDSGVAGKRVISFHGDMRFQFDSGGSQKHPLDVNLNLPHLQFVDSGCVDCGACHVGKETVRLAHLTNKSMTTAFWKIADFKSDTFTIGQNEGTLRAAGDDPAASNVLIKVSFKPETDKVYNEMLLVHVYPCGKTIPLQISGTGTLDESDK